MPKLNCMGQMMEIPSGGKICPNLPTSIVPMGTKCEVSCSSGSANVEYLKCDKDGWTPTDEVTCSGTNTAMVIGLTIGGIFAVVIIAYIYAKVKLKRKNKELGKKNNQPVSRAAKIAAVNDMVVTGVVTRDVVKSGAVKQPHRPGKGRLVTGITEEPVIRHSSSSSQNISSPPSYHSYDYNEDKNYDGNPPRSGRKSKRQHTSNTEMQPIQHKKLSYHEEYPEDADLGYQEGHALAAYDGQYHSAQENGPAYPDYYGPRSNAPYSYGGVDQTYYSQGMGAYPNHYLTGGADNMGYSQGGANYNHKPYRVPI